MTRVVLVAVAALGIAAVWMLSNDATAPDPATANPEGSPVPTTIAPAARDTAAAAVAPSTNERPVTPNETAAHPISVNFPTNSVYPDHPLALYQDNIEDAQNGDVNAQYQVYRAALECQRAVDDYDALEQIRDTSRNAQYVAEMEFLFERCAGLQSLVGDVGELRQQWYGLSILNGHPITTGHYNVVYGDDLASAKQPISTALESGDHEAFTLAALYVRKVEGDYAPLAVEPWSYLACARNAGCNTAAFVNEYLQSEYAPHDVDEILRRAEGIESRLAAGEDLLPDYYPAVSPVQ